MKQNLIAFTVVVLVFLAVAAQAQEKPEPRGTEVPKPFVPPKPTPYIPPTTPTEFSRTIYRGHVGIEPTSLTAIQEKLEAQGCKQFVSSGENFGCRYREETILIGEEKKPEERLPGRAVPVVDGVRQEEPSRPAEETATKSTQEVKVIMVYPRGPGFGPVSFALSENKLYAIKDIPGAPDNEKFKEAVRQDVAGVGAVVTIKENSWKITDAIYPVDVVYAPGYDGATDLLSFVERANRPRGINMQTIGWIAAFVVVVLVFWIISKKRKKA